MQDDSKGTEISAFVVRVKHGRVFLQILYAGLGFWRSFLWSDSDLSVVLVPQFTVEMKMGREWSVSMCLCGAFVKIQSNKY